MPVNIHTEIHIHLVIMISIKERGVLHIFDCFSGCYVGATAEQLRIETKEEGAESVSSEAGKEENGQRICTNTGDLYI